MGAPLGNTNGRNARIFRDSLHKVLTTYESEERNIKQGEALHEINVGLVEQALDGKEWATQMVANRTDGKPVQVQEIEVTHTARSVVIGFRSRLDDISVRTMLQVAGANNLIPVLEQLILEDQRIIEHDPA